MSRTKIFVSSTFFDLEQIREDIRTTITQLGHEPLLSEYHSFPTLPDLDTIENCKKAVQASDLFVLVIGGRRGSLDPASGRPIVNLEFEAALQQGMSCFVFVNHSIMTLLPVWRKNPVADFSPMVDDPQVFKFVDSIKEKQKWIFTFSKASEVSEVLRIQLSVFLKSLLDRRTTGRLDPLKGFETESEKARAIALDRPDFWEYLLTAELLRTKLSVLQQEYDDFQSGLVYKPKRHVSAQEYFELLSSRMSDPTDLSSVIKKSLEGELVASWGLPGEPGDPHQILRAVNRIATSCKNLLEWEVEVRALRPPDVLVRLGDTLRGLTRVFIDELERLPREHEDAVKGCFEGVKQVSIKLDFPAPPQLAAFTTEMEEVRNHPEWLTL
jgi:hypothetical protein